MFRKKCDINLMDLNNKITEKTLFCSFDLLANISIKFCNVCLTRGKYHDLSLRVQD